MSFFRFSPFMKIKILFAGLFLLSSITASAQIGKYRNVFSVGVNGGVSLSKIAFQPDVTQSQHLGPTFGILFRYTPEKYFSTICSIQAEVNYTSMGWKERILDVNNQGVALSDGSGTQHYSRTISYVQVPLLTHLAWGKEKKGLQFFINLGPQFGYKVGESTDCNFDVREEMQKVANGTSTRSNVTMAQDTMSVEHAFDYGIAVGAGFEYVHPKFGRFFIEGRYYLGLGNIYGSTKRDYFQRSDFNNILIKVGYIRDL